MEKHALSRLGSQAQAVEYEMAGRRPEPSTTSECSTNSEASTRKQPRPTGGWDYVYLKSSRDGEGKLVELVDSQERCSNVSTVLGPMGFVTPITLAVPCHLLPLGAVPVMAGNTIELGDWDVAAAESMTPATCELQAPGYAFFSAPIHSNYSTEEEVLFRFAVLVAPPARAGAEVHCWEGRFVRRVADYTSRGGGVAFLVFGRPEPMASTAELLTAVANLPPPPALSAGWLTDPAQAVLLLRLEPPQLDPSDKQQHRRLSVVPVEVTLTWDSPSRLTPNFRGPLALGGTVVASAAADGAVPPVLHFPTAQDVRAEFLQQVTLDAAVSPVLHFRFGADSLEATARLPQQFLATSLPLMLPEEEFITCDLRPVSQSAGARRHNSIGQVGVRLRRLRHCRRCPADLLRSLDRCGPAFGPPDGPRPIRVARMPPREELPSLSASLASPYFELPIGVSADGRLTCFVRGGAATASAALCSAVDLDSGAVACHGLAVRVVRDPADPSEVAEAAADAVLALLLPTERWALLVAPDLPMCALLCLKQMRLPVALALAGGAATTAVLDACRHYGVRAVVAPAAALTATTLLADARARGLAVYAFGGLAAEVAASLEGVFGDGTFAECRFEDADSSMVIVPSSAEDIPAAKRSVCSRLF